jgi:hypothetical protein
MKNLGGNVNHKQTLSRVVMRGMVAATAAESKTFVNLFTVTREAEDKD